MNIVPTVTDNFSSELAREADLAVGCLRVWIHGRQFPESNDYWDGNWLRVTATCIEGETSVTARGSFINLGEIAGLLRGCEKHYETLSGVARLNCIEPNLKISLEARSLGHIGVQIELTPDHMRERHEFRDEIDQTFLPTVIASCYRIFNAFPLRQPEKCLAWTSATI